ncbi:MAG: hypothetical protein C0404_13365 [Verrucomicrobia bacterium]|nr:hypothetical protein [Verrucomicrobiota bacterium]
MTAYARLDLYTNGVFYQYLARDAIYQVSTATFALKNRGLFNVDRTDMSVKLMTQGNQLAVFITNSVALPQNTGITGVRVQ